MLMNSGTDLLFQLNNINNWWFGFGLDPLSEDNRAAPKNCCSI